MMKDRTRARGAAFHVRARGQAGPYMGDETRDQEGVNQDPMGKAVEQHDLGLCY